MQNDHPDGTATPETVIENKRVRVTKWHFAKRGDNTGWHRHGYDYIVVPLFDGNLEIQDSAGNRTTAAMSNGAPYFREAGVEHDVINGNDFACAFVEIELLENY